MNTDIEMNPHQINAFIAAIHALKTGGIVLADEVGLGKTIEAGLVLKYVLDTGAKRVLIALPATLRKQWEVEMDEKFGLGSTILDRLTVEKDYFGTKAWIEDPKATRIIITSYDYASKLMKRFPSVKWDFLIIDEAHNLRNVFHGTKRAKRLYAQELKAATIEKSDQVVAVAVCRRRSEEPHGQRAPYAIHAMDRDGADRIVDVQFV